VHLVGQDEKQFVVFYIEWLQVDTVPGAAFQHKKKKALRFAVDKVVWSGDFGRQVAEVWRNETDGKFVILLKWI
jgi:hypothetical protein